ncbi:MAG: MarR family transcriptional regulator [Hydrogenophaga sp.]|jgi:DNA-binding MarR family transcriptional regulator|uniref:MarR family winged helix-turn-helix transcriptional regulator n=1 Tax=Hydrogenophaga sp. TaxID=1904254 RepID=UPI002631AC79|nr:MarR family transcriptional regulator [Hydrogenophaga sp.]MCW5671137.1 MarR family transcriptional regulator [Hydrogenophaga sp.]
MDQKRSLNKPPSKPARRKPAPRGAEPSPAPARVAPPRAVRPKLDEPKLAMESTPAGRLREGALQQLLGYQLAQASIVTIGLFQDVVGNAHSLRTVEYTLLALIHANPMVSPAQLTKALGLSAPYITNGLDKLAGRGLIVRETNENDRRGFHLSVTAQGEALAQELTARLLDNEKASFKTLSPAEHLMLAELLHKLARSR